MLGPPSAGGGSNLNKICLYPEVLGDQRVSLREPVVKYRDVFALNDSEQGSTKVVEHRAETYDSEFVKVPHHRISPPRSHIVKDRIRKILVGGVIQQSESPYSAPLLLQ